MREKTFIELFYNLSPLASFPLFITEKPSILEKIICNPRFEKSKEKFEILKNIFLSFTCTSNQLELLLFKMADRLTEVPR